jgi:pimeloyl-ACP methyl ester carboxylesterase
MTTPQTTTSTTIDTAFGPCTVHLDGPESGPPVLLVHGVLVDATVWDGITPGLAAGHRVIRPDLPLGAHLVPARDRSRLHPDGLADALVEVLDALGVTRAAVVGSDTGGAIAQVLAARHPDRVQALVLLSCDALDHLPPTVLKPIVPLLRIPAVVDLIGRLYAVPRVRRSWIGAGLLLVHPIDDAVIAPWFTKVATNREARHDMAAFLRRCRPAVGHAAADALEARPVPLLLAWSGDDRLFPESDARELQRRIAGAELELLDGVRTFSQVDRPEAVLSRVLPFLARHEVVPTA